MDRGRTGPERAHARVAVDAFVRIVGGQREFVFRTRDLSVGGLFLYTKVGHLFPFKEGTALTIELFDFDQSVDFKAVVVRIVQSGSPEAERFPAGFGLKIVELDEVNRVRLEKLIARLQRGEALY